VGDNIEEHILQVSCVYVLCICRVAVATTSYILLVNFRLTKSIRKVNILSNIIAVTYILCY